MPVAVTNDIKVSVETAYQGFNPQTQGGPFVFAYRVTIENNGDQTVQLLRRHWHIIDSTEGHKEVEGEGVIGEQPVLEPGGFHQYTSGCNLYSEMGKMYGEYIFERLTDGKLFEVSIPEFKLLAPYRNN